MNDREERLLEALVSMTRQYLNYERGLVDSDAISAAEHAIEALVEYGLMEKVPMGRIFARWTPAGREFYYSHLGLPVPDEKEEEAAYYKWRGFGKRNEKKG
jgi:hypothetical protein